MIPFDWRDPHVEAFRQWKKARWAMETFPNLADFFSDRAKVWYGQYMMLRAQCIYDWVKYEEEREKNR